MMVMYGSTIFTIMLSKGRIEDARLWYAPWLFQGEHASMAGLSTSGTLTHWFRDNAARELDPAQGLRDARQGGGGVAARREGPGRAALFLRRADADPRSRRPRASIFGLNLTHKRGDIYRALLEGIACGTNHIIETYREIGADAEEAARGRRRHQEPRLVAGDVGHFRHDADRLRARPSAPATATPSSRRSPSATSAKKDIRDWNPEERRIVPERKNRAGL